MVISLTKKKLKILGVILAVIYSFILHFLYDKAPCFLTSVITPVNESLFEHMKLLFSSIILSGITQKIITKKLKLNYNNVCFSNFISALISIPIFLVMFMPIHYNFNHNLFITILIMIIAIIISEYIGYIIMNKKDLKLENKTIFFVIIAYVIFTIFTYFPVKSDFFIDSLTNSYGIKK